MYSLDFSRFIQISVIIVFFIFMFTFLHAKIWCNMRILLTTTCSKHRSYSGLQKMLVIYLEDCVRQKGSLKLLDAY